MFPVMTQLPLFLSPLLLIWTEVEARLRGGY
jgi:hypothetical protein